MTTDSTTTVDDTKLFLGDAWSDPIEAGIRDRIRGFIEELIERGRLAGAARRSRRRRAEDARVPDRRRRGRPGEGARGAVAGRADPALHGSQAQEPPGRPIPCTRRSRPT